MILKKVITGAQTGVDRAALHAAVKAGLPVESYCTKGRPDVDVLIPGDYLFQELETRRCPIRIENNVVISGGTLIINKGPLTQGTKLSYDFSVRHFMPCLIVQLDAEEVITPPNVVSWIHAHQITTLNVAGPKESKLPEGIYTDAYSYLENLFTVLKDGYRGNGPDKRRR
jgi:hypothetical protein